MVAIGFFDVFKNKRWAVSQGTRPFGARSA
jgi:hypothetical protein